MNTKIYKKNTTIFFSSFHFQIQNLLFVAFQLIIFAAILEVKISNESDYDYIHKPHFLMFSISNAMAMLPDYTFFL